MLIDDFKLDLPRYDLSPERKTTLALLSLEIEVLHEVLLFLHLLLRIIRLLPLSSARLLEPLLVRKLLKLSLQVLFACTSLLSLTLFAQRNVVILHDLQDIVLIAAVNRALGQVSHDLSGAPPHACMIAAESLVSLDAEALGGAVALHY